MRLKMSDQKAVWVGNVPHGTNKGTLRHALEAMGVRGIVDIKMRHYGMLSDGNLSSAVVKFQAPWQTMACMRLDGQTPAGWMHPLVCNIANTPCYVAKAGAQDS